MKKWKFRVKLGLPENLEIEAETEEEAWEKVGKKLVSHLPELYLEE